MIRVESKEKENTDIRPFASLAYTYAQFSWSLSPKCIHRHFHAVGEQWSPRRVKFSILWKFRSFVVEIQLKRIFEKEDKKIYAYEFLSLSFCNMKVVILLEIFVLGFDWR